jgi:hypothetical protein
MDFLFDFSVLLSQPSFGLEEEELAELHPLDVQHNSVKSHQHLARVKEVFSGIRILHYSIAVRRACCAGCVPCSIGFYLAGNEFIQPIADAGEFVDRISIFWSQAYQTLVQLLNRKIVDVSSRPFLPKPPMNKNSRSVSVSQAQSGSSGPFGAQFGAPNSEAPITHYRGFRKSADFPEWRRRTVPSLRHVYLLPILSQYSRIPVPSMSKTKIPLNIRNDLDRGAMGYHPQDLFFGASVCCERAFLINDSEVAALSAFRPSNHLSRLVFIHGHALANYRLTVVERYHTMVTDAPPPTQILEDYFDRNAVEVWQVYAPADLSDMSNVLNLLRVCERLKSPKKMTIVLSNEFQSSFQTAIGGRIPAEALSNIIAHQMQFLRFHLKANAVIFAGYGCEIRNDEEGKLRTEIIDRLRQHNPQWASECGYITDVLSFSSSIGNSESIFADWKRRRVESTLYYLVASLLREFEEPFAPPQSGQVQGAGFGNLAPADSVPANPGLSSFGNQRGAFGPRGGRNRSRGYVSGNSGFGYSGNSSDGNRSNHSGNRSDNSNR